ncbi:MAG: hypothetical protein ACJAZD_002399 [Ilumatobacter sp.]|jgi:hypothetical protein
MLQRLSGIVGAGSGSCGDACFDRCDACFDRCDACFDGCNVPSDGLSAHGSAVAVKHFGQSAAVQPGLDRARFQPNQTSKPLNH